MKVLSKSKDGGYESTVWAYWLIELKKLFSIALLRFERGTRDAYHSHAFNCISWLIKGKLVEHHKDGHIVTYYPSLKPIITKRETFHKVVSEGRSWVITFRGPWANSWEEFIPASNQTVSLTHGRLLTEASSGKEEGS